MGERNILVAEAAAVLERTHGVNDSAAAHRMAQEGLIRKLRRGAGNNGKIAKLLITDLWELQHYWGGIQWPRKWVYARRFCAPCSRSVTI